MALGLTEIFNTNSWVKVTTPHFSLLLLTTLSLAFPKYNSRFGMFKAFKKLLSYPIFEIRLCVKVMKVPRYSISHVVNLPPKFAFISLSIILYTPGRGP